MANWIEMEVVDLNNKRGHVFEALNQVAAKWMWNYM